MQCSTHHNLGEPQFVVMQGEQVEAEPDENHMWKRQTTVDMIVDEEEIDKDFFCTD